MTEQFETGTAVLSSGRVRSVRLAGLAGLIGGILLIVVAVIAWIAVTTQLRAENITIPDDAIALQGQQVGGPITAYIQADIINKHAMEASGGKTYRAGIAVVLATSFLTVWTTVVRDDGNGIGFFLLIMAAAVGAFSAWFRPAGMARTMLGVAIMQVLLGIAIATAPSPICCSLPARWR